MADAAVVGYSRMAVKEEKVRFRPKNVLLPVRIGKNVTERSEEWGRKGGPSEAHAAARGSAVAREQRLPYPGGLPGRHPAAERMVRGARHDR